MGLSLSGPVEKAEALKKYVFHPLIIFLDSVFNAAEGYMLTLGAGRGEFD